MKALLVIDMQEEYVGENNRHGHDHEWLIYTANAIVKAAKAAGELIVYIKNGRCQKNGSTVFSDFAADLDVVSDNIIEKLTSSAFTNPRLLPLLRENDVTEVKCIGVDANYCVASTAIDACKNGLSTVLLCSAVSAKQKDKFPRTLELLRRSGVVIGI